MKKGAVIDLGTNTFNLLVFEGDVKKFKFLYSTRIPVGLGLGGILKNTIAEDAFQRGVDAISKFKAICKTYGVTHIKAFGTSALRGAANRDDFCEAVAESTGIRIQVISGKEEARLIYEGVKLVHDYQKDAFIMDIGGGSTEFILADQNGVKAIESFDIGVSRMLQQFELSDPLSDSDKQRVEQFLSERVGQFFQQHPCDVIIGASGSFETFYQFIYEEEFTSEYQSKPLAFEELMLTLDQLINSTLEERMQSTVISEIRKKMIHLAALKTKWVIQQMGAKEAWISPASLKEGAISSF
jgi:exopolyphosphatase / guanosine-5'-triphosphate,3'-diphosphate pyrophosphatase